MIKLTEKEALNEPGDLYRHKKGGIYRREAFTTVRDPKLPWKGQLKYSPGELLVTYEHLWPHDRAFYQRPHREMADQDRFVKIIHLRG